jgi:YebC/PmpR family DNA-binding regulatory protein
MSGHSKWSTIKHAKGAADAKRGKMFSKVGRAIAIAVKEGGSDNPESNAHLRLAIEQARAINMPKDNIKRAIDRGAGRGGSGVLETITYEGFGPEKTAIIVECVTDNRNRTTSEIKSFFEKGGGNLGSPGSTAYLFQKCGFILAAKTSQDTQADLLKLIDLGVEDVEEAGDLIEVYTKPEQLEEFKGKIAAAGFNVKEASLTFKPVSVMTISDSRQKERILNFLQDLDDFEDVQKVYCNADFQD